MNDRDKLLLEILREEVSKEVINTFNFPWTSLEATKEKWDRYYSEQKVHIRDGCLA